MACSASEVLPPSVKSEMIEVEGRELCMHTWANQNEDDNINSDSNSLVVIYHGFLAHGRYPTVSIAATTLASAGYTVMAADMPGHGKSAGQKGYLPSPDEVINLGVAIAKWAHHRHFEKSEGTSADTTRKKLFLLGSSMGGTIALAAGRKMTATNDATIHLAGVVLVAPMLKLAIDTPTRYLLHGLNAFCSTWEVIPSSSTNSEKQYRDPIKRKQCDDDEFANKSGRICVGSACTCVELANNIADGFPAMDFPLLVLVAEEDVVVDNEGSYQLMEKASSEDKTMKRYPALHGLLCEPSPLVDNVQDDIIQWVNERTAG